MSGENAKVLEILDPLITETRGEIHVEGNVTKLLYPNNEIVFTDWSIVVRSRHDPERKYQFTITHRSITDAVLQISTLICDSEFVSSKEPKTYTSLDSSSVGGWSIIEDSAVFCGSDVFLAFSNTQRVLMTHAQERMKNYPAWKLVISTPKNPIFMCRDYSGDFKSNHQVGFTVRLVRKDFPAPSVALIASFKSKTGKTKKVIVNSMAPTEFPNAMKIVVNNMIDYCVSFPETEEVMRKAGFIVEEFDGGAPPPVSTSLAGCYAFYDEAEYLTSKILRADNE